MEYRTDNPGDRVRSVLGPQNRVVKHTKALPHGEVGAGIRKARTTDGMPVAKLAFESLVLTAARWGEVRWAEWLEIDLGEGVWTVPASRMKAKREHRVPLCCRALEILDEARALGGEDSPLVFTRLTGRPLIEKRLLQLLRQHRFAAVLYGFRSSFRDGAAEETDHTPGRSSKLHWRTWSRTRVGSRAPAYRPFRAAAAVHGRLGGVSGGPESRHRDLTPARRAQRPFPVGPGAIRIR